jgi:ribosomal protein L37AE/L43A
MPLDDPFVCKRCYGHAFYAGRRHGETIYRCQSCGAEIGSLTKPAVNNSSSRSPMRRMKQTDELEEICDGVH